MWRDTGWNMIGVVRQICSCLLVCMLVVGCGGGDDNNGGDGGETDTGDAFLKGINHPWIAYAHDFGRNQWGHDGFSTAGWTYQTWQDSQGCTDTKRGNTMAHTGAGSLEVQLNLVGQDPHRSSGEVYVDLQNHPLGGQKLLDLRSAVLRCWVHLPAGSAGNPSVPNGVQFFVKSQGWSSWYGPWNNIQQHWENNWVELSVSLDATPAYMDATFDPASVIAVGLKIGIGSSSSSVIQGVAFLDDFGVDGGGAFDFERTEVEEQFMSFKNDGYEVVRVFVFGDGRASPEFDANGTPSGFDDAFCADFDALLAAARKADLQLIPVLLDFHWCDQAVMVSGAQTGGHADVIRDPAKRAAFISNVLTPLMQGYGGDPMICCWEVINEPEWACTGIPGGGSVADPVPLADMQEFVRQCVEVIHQSSNAKATVGSARRSWIPYWQQTGLNIAQFHWYDTMAATEPFPWPSVADLGINIPCIVGEVPIGDSSHSNQEFVDAATNGGYAGVLFWSHNAGAGLEQ